MKIGYACQTLSVPGTSFKNCTLKNATPDVLSSVIEQNLTALDHILDYNIANHISLFRITSDLIPFGSSPVNTLDWKNIFHSQFELLGGKIQKHGIRISMHPGQYTVLNSPHDSVVERAIQDLLYHTELLECLDADSRNKIILHIGGVYGDKETAMERFIKNYQKLDDRIRKHLVLENDDKLYSVSDVLELSAVTGAPVVFDVLHHELNPGREPKSVYDWIRICRDTWTSSDGPQKIHYSQQNPSKRPGSHSETISLDSFQTFLAGLCPLTPDIMLEVKDKNLSAIKCLNLIAKVSSITSLELEWSRYKYLVLEHSQADYNQIRLLLKDKHQYPVSEFYRLTDHALSQPITIGSAVNAADHVWGYFKDRAEEKERKKYLSLRDTITPDSQAHRRFLWKMTLKYQETYLLQSHYFIPLFCIRN